LPAHVRRFGANSCDLAAIADWLAACGVTTVAMESTGVYWIPRFELLASRGLEVWLVEPGQLSRCGARPKTDVLDVQWIQRLHSYGLRTVPGVGPRTAEVVAAHLDNPRRFTKGKQVSAYAGLVPRQFQSGESDRRGRITKRGPAILRKLLVECAWAMLRYNAWARAVWSRLTRGGTTRKKPAIVALARRLLVRCWAMLRDGKPWREEPAPIAAVI
jgi:transposase